MEKLRRLIKSNHFVRGFYMFLRTNFGISRHKFGYCADSVVFTPMAWEPKGYIFSCHFNGYYY